MAKKKLFDLESAFETAASANLDPGVLKSRIIMPKPKNVIDWAQGAQFLNLPQELYARQAEAAVRYTADYCPICTDLAYLDDVPVKDTLRDFCSNVVLLEEGVCPSCNRNRKEAFQLWWDQGGSDNWENASPVYRPPYKFASCWGQRSGKSMICGSVLMTYKTQQYLQIPDPFSYYKILPGAIIMSFLAQDLTRAKTQLWPYYHNVVNNGTPWFREYTKQARLKEKELGLAHESLFTIRNEFVKFGYLLIQNQVVDGGILRGATRLGVVIDEIAFLPRGTEYVASADTAYTALLNSLGTLQAKADAMWDAGDYNVPFTSMLNISSPAHQYDKIMELMEEAKEDPRVISSHLATWDMVPWLPRDCDFFRGIKDPVELTRNFGAEPPLANSPYISNFEAIEGCQKPYTKPVHITTVPADVAGVPHVGAAIKDVTSNKSMKTIVSLDGGHANNSFAVSMTHLETEGNEVIMQVDENFCAIPETYSDRKVKVSFVSMADLVIELNKHFNVVCVRYDRWNSIGEIERLRKLGIEAECYSPKFQDFEAFKQLVYAGHLRIPQWEKPINKLNLDSVLDLRENPNAHLGYQISTVQGLGKKVGKPAKGDDDMFRTLVSAYAKFRLNPAHYLTSGIQQPGQVKGGGMRAVMSTHGGTKRMVGTAGGGVATTSRAVSRKYTR